MILRSLIIWLVFLENSLFACKIPEYWPVMKCFVKRSILYPKNFAQQVSEQADNAKIAAWVSHMGPARDRARLKEPHKIQTFFVFPFFWGSTHGPTRSNLIYSRCQHVIEPLCQISAWASNMVPARKLAILKTCKDYMIFKPPLSF